MALERWWNAWRVRMRHLVNRDRAERELGEELRAHVALEAAARRADGLPPPEARRQALARLGGVEAAKEAVRATRPGAACEQLVQDVRYGVRILRHRPGYTTVIVLTLAIGVGAATTIFSVVDAVLLHPPAFPDPDRLVTLWQTDPARGHALDEVAPANFLDWRAQAGSFAHMAAAEPWSLDYTGGDEPVVLLTGRVTDGFFEALGVVAAHGRTFLRPEYHPGGPDVVLLTDGLWRRRFGGDPAVVGQAISLDARPHTVVGILPPEFELALGTREREAFIPKVIAEYETRLRGGGWWHVLGRLRPGVTPADAQAEMTTIAGRLGVDHPRTNAEVGARVVPLHTRQVGHVRGALLLLSGAVVLLLLIACVNVANLMLARGLQRTPELAVRAAIGGGRARLIRQLLTEGIVVAALSGGVGMVVAVFAVDLVVGLSPPDVPRLDQIGVDLRVLAFATLLAVVTAVGCAAAPAGQTRHANLGDQLTHGTRVGPGQGHQRLRAGLVVTEIALALVLLVGAGLLVKSFARLTRVDLGFAPEHLVTLQTFAWDRHDDGAARANFYRQTLDAVRALPGVEAAAAVSSFPLGLADVSVESAFTIQGQPVPPPGEEPTTMVSVATPRYLETMRIPLRRGRWFDERDDARRPAVAVINTTLAQRYWPNTDPLASRVVVQWQDQVLDLEVVGIIGTMRPRGFDSQPRAELYLPHAQQPTGSMTYVIRADGNLAATTPTIQQAIWRIDPLQTFYSVATLDQLLRNTLATRRLVTVLLTVFGVVSLALAAIGIYGVIALTTGQRTHEFGLRVALGAQARDIVGTVVRSALVLAATGIALGLVSSLWLARGLSTLLYDVAPSDPATLGGVALLLLLVAATAAYFPARRATRVDPLTALRAE